MTRSSWSDGSPEPPVPPPAPAPRAAQPQLKRRRLRIDTVTQASRNTIPVAKWKELIDKYKKGKYKSHAQFLRTEGMDERKYKTIFSRRAQQHEAGLLKETSGKIVCSINNDSGVWGLSIALEFWPAADRWNR